MPHGARDRKLPAATLNALFTLPQFRNWIRAIESVMMH